MGPADNKINSVGVLWSSTATRCGDKKRNEKKKKQETYIYIAYDKAMVVATVTTQGWGGTRGPCDLLTRGATTQNGQKLCERIT